MDVKVSAFYQKIALDKNEKDFPLFHRIIVEIEVLDNLLNGESHHD